MDKKIALIAPSGAFDGAEYKVSLALAKQAHFEVVHQATQNPSIPSFVNGTPEQRLAEVASAYGTAPHALWCVRGGVGALDIFSALCQEPHYDDTAPIIGYSDGTVVHLARFYGRGRIGIHGPGFIELAREEKEVDITSIHLLLDKKTEDVAYPHLTVLHVGRQSAIRGPLLVMNLVSLASLMGIVPHGFFEGKILALEDVNEPPYKVFRALKQLLWCGALRGIKALIVGHFNDDRPTVISEVFLPLAQALNLPLFDWPIFGHEPGNRPLLFGADCMLVPSAGAWQLRFLQHWDSAPTRFG